MAEHNNKSLDEESSPHDGQNDAIVELMRARGLDMDADTYAYLAFNRDIDELTAEELDTIPAFLLDPWLAERDGEAAT